MADACCIIGFPPSMGCRRERHERTQPKSTTRPKANAAVGRDTAAASRAMRRLTWDFLGRIRRGLGRVLELGFVTRLVP
ncbi:hypothetical protein GCM10018783_00630 [Streptomyces griseosporeus]|nr:hypothetical protein GCM10018783_00630 [Streptomyces griseosporeus]